MSSGSCVNEKVVSRDKVSIHSLLRSQALSQEEWKRGVAPSRQPSVHIPGSRSCRPRNN